MRGEQQCTTNGVAAMLLSENVTPASSLQGVPAARQKLMARGAWKGILKDDVDLSGCTIKDGQQARLALGGQAGALYLSYGRRKEDCNSGTIDGILSQE